MSIRSILMVFNGEANELNALDTALSLGHACRGLIRILHVAAPPVLSDFSPLGLYGAASYPDEGTLEKLDEIEAELTRQTVTYAQSACQRHGIVLRTDGGAVSPGQCQAELLVSTGHLPQILVEKAAFADLVVAGYDNRPDGDLDVVLTGLFQAGRPVLALPHRPQATLPSTGFARTVVFAWDGSQACSRALREAVPHMLHATSVYALHVRSDGADPQDDVRRDMTDYLQSHCISVVNVSAETGEMRVGETILTEARRLKADLLIMGAYGHGHLSEMVLGGVTNHVLKHADLPLLLVH